VYIKINSSGFSSVKVPDLIEKTYREAVPTLKALVRRVITYIPNLEKTWFLTCAKGRSIKAEKKS
jgi:beta-lactam-binding protein with PASTA domain